MIYLLFRVLLLVQITFLVTQKVYWAKICGCRAVIVTSLQGKIRVKYGQTPQDYPYHLIMSPIRFITLSIGRIKI